MNLKRIHGNTYYIPGATNIGVYLFKDKYTLLVDSGINNQQTRKITEILSEHNMNVKYIINTHNHIDHTGGNSFIKEHFPGSIIYASEKEKLYIENDLLFPLYLYGGYPINYFAKNFKRSKENLVDETIYTGINKINNEKFEIIAIPGHAEGQIGIGTRDRVVFLGDALFSEEIINKYSFPFLFNIKEQLDTYDIIGSLDYDYFVLSHGENIYDKKEINNLIEINKNNLDKYFEIIIELLNQPKTKEDLLEEITILEDLNLDLKEYYFSLSTVAAFITFLYNKEIIKYELENGKLYFYKG
ncbi:Glyoxylase, beta-lactamase superfamily II [Desulfonispora thiosulfatigenes DSM 11270]|uniref:Glyoxylase, beta-lactamase superfamily II n=1 Tax=Desulfonispora thiosulfatigenes DSM 11270 TaxID=656914 RepID=A0A1W1VG29_DESTI|nr:MBL fold metallo-hydrolase [Desulfonispora thiosulfatigenes]SMB92312.1 Glyoxylase, beta-lactamase superfamily II [Desulfonispora thiosulfatigenes DSM 11270]